MPWLQVVCVLVILYGGGGVTQTSESGISKFWTDDFKIFEQIYGRTSDKHLYGAKLPPNYRSGANHSEKNEAGEKKERSIANNHDVDTFGAASHVDSNGIAQQKVKSVKKTYKNHKPATQAKPLSFTQTNPLSLTQTPLSLTQTPLSLTQAKSSVNFVTYSDFKPITQINDPQTYSYLKHLEAMQSPILDFQSSGGFKPYKSYTGTNPEGTDSFRSIQDILKAHEANKGNANRNIDHDDVVKYVNSESFKGRKKINKTKYGHSSKKTKPICQGKCRKRGAKPIRLQSRPVVRKIKHTVIRN